MIKNFENWIVESTGRNTTWYETLPEYYERIDKLSTFGFSIGKKHVNKPADELEIGNKNSLCLQFFIDFYKLDSAIKQRFPLKWVKDQLVIVHSEVTSLPWKDENDPNRLFAILRNIKYEESVSMSSFNQVSLNGYYLQPFPICKTTGMCYIIQKTVADKLIHDNRGKINSYKYNI